MISLPFVREILHSKLTERTPTIVLREIGSSAGGCGVTLRDNVLVKPNEEYVLFLRADRRKPAAPNATGSPWFVAIGIWSGKAQIINGRIKFLPSVLPGLRIYNNKDAAEFVEVVKQRIRVIYRHRPSGTGWSPETEDGFRLVGAHP